MADIYSKIPLAGFAGYTALEIAKGLQREFYSISRPPEVRNPDDISEYLAGWITHPITGQIAIVLPDISVRKHNMATPERLIEFLKDRLTEQQKQNVRTYYQNNGVISIQELFEQLFPSQTITRQELDAEGWFATIEI